MIRIYNEDCLTAMRAMIDNQFDLAIVDPPYGMPSFGTQTGGINKRSGYQTNEVRAWDIAPPEEYFSELERVSKNRIIWGGNYFNLPPTRGIIAWDKFQYNPKFSAVELAWTSFQKPSKILRLRSADSNRIHPTQKPVSLYKFLLNHYAEEGDKILDTHLGSASSAIACHDMGFDFTGYELNKEYFVKAKERLDNHQAQIRLFA